MVADPAGLAETSEVAPNLAPPPGNPRFPLFDGLRAIAALSVFLGHTVTETYSLTAHRNLFLAAVQLADQGVAIFFAISGFLLYRPFVAARFRGRPLSLRGFAERRALRIIPAYWFALTLFLATGLVSGVTAHNWWIFYGFGQIYSANTIGHGIGVAWTLCIEVTFYIALPILAAVAARLTRGRRSVRWDCGLLIILAAASLAFRAHFHQFAQFAVVSTLPGTFFWFAVGMGLGAISVAWEDRPPQSSTSRFVAGRLALFWALAAGLSLIQYRLFRVQPSVAIQLATHLLYGLIALSLVLPGVFGDGRAGVVRRLLALPALAWIGLISYAFYLYHTIVIAEINKLVSAQHLPARYVVVLIVSGALSCACAAASYYLLERPVMRLGRASRRARGGSRPGR